MLRLKLVGPHQPEGQVVLDCKRSVAVPLVGLIVVPKTVVEGYSDSHHLIGRADARVRFELTVIRLD